MDAAKPSGTDALAESAPEAHLASQSDHPHTPAVAGPSPMAPDRLVQLRQAFLLGQLAKQGTGRKTAGELNRLMGAAARRELQLSPEVANKVRLELVEQSYLTTHKNGRNISYELTETGRAYLATLERPVLAGRTTRSAAVDETAIPDDLREAQKAYLLLQLLDTDGQPVSRGEANKMRDGLRASLGLKAALANYRRARLADQGYLRITTAGKSEQYSLTADGLDYLAASTRHLEHAAFTIKGKTLNALAAARESSFERDRPAGSGAPDGPVPSQEELAEAVLAEFEELRRERYGRSGLVPIHEIRQRIAARFGPAAARHDVLDEVILSLWRERSVGLEAISDLGDASEQQMNDSIQGVSGTLFYVEVPREQPVAAEPLQ